MAVFCVYGTSAMRMYMCHVLCAEVRRQSLCHSLLCILFEAGSVCFSPLYCMPGGRTMIILWLACLCSYLSVGTQISETCHIWPFMGLENLNSGPCASVTSVLPTEIFPLFLLCSFKSRNFVSRKEKGRSAVWDVEKWESLHNWWDWEMMQLSVESTVILK